MLMPLRDAVKSGLRWIFWFTMLPLFIGWQVLGRVMDSNGLFAALSQLLSLLPGAIGSYARAGFYRQAMRHCAPDVRVEFGSLFSHPSTEIESGVYIGAQCNIGLSRIGADCLLGSAVHVLSGKQQHSAASLAVPVRDQGGVLTQITIGEDCWIGNGAIVMADIGQHCIVGAGSVVVDPVDDFAIVAGNPARVIGDRRRLPMDR